MALNCKTVADVEKAIKDNNIQFIDMKFTDVYGQWHHFSLPVGYYDMGDIFDNGIAFDGSSIRGFKSIENSDMMLVGDPTTAFLDPICDHPTISITGNVYDPITRDAFDRDPRNIIRRAEQYMKDTGIADSVFMGPEAEFFIFDKVSYGAGRNFSNYAIESQEGPWTTTTPGHGHIPNWKGGYFPVPPIDSLQNVRAEIVKVMLDTGLPIEKHHHEVASAGQCEINLRFASMIQMADNMQLYKYIAKNVAARFGKTVTFMPKPLFEDNGSGMHTHQSLWKDGKPLFAGDKYAGLSDLALWYIGGILKHINSILAFAAPTTNSYRRLVPGYEAPVVVAYSARNRSAACRIPVGVSSPKARRVEFRCADPSANPYLAFSAMLMAGLDGIKNKIDPGNPSEMDLFEGETIKHVKTVKGSLGEVLDSLEADHDFLTAGNVFNQEMIDTYVGLKRIADVDAVRLRPHPQEFVMYFGV